MALTSSAAAPVPTHHADLLIVDGSAEAAGYAATLRGTYRVAVTTSPDLAKQLLERHAPALVVTELDLDGSDGVEICRAAKALPNPPAVLVTTADTARVPDALVAGCDGVLLKPFAPNLLFARIGRMLRQEPGSGTNRVWPSTRCPHCNHIGVTSFEFSSHRRSWYACLECKKVWIAKRQE